MNSLNRKFWPKLASLSLRERIILLCLLALLLVYGMDFLFNKLYLESNRELKAAVANAEERFQRHRLLLSRQEQIHARYKELESPVSASRDSILTETEVLRELSDLAGRQVRVKSVVPRLGYHEGQQVMFVALDFEGPFQAVIEYVGKILDEMPSEMSGLSLAPRTGNESGVVCRISIRVDCIES